MSEVTTAAPPCHLILKRASASRSSGEWSESDYDVLAEGVVVGRILRAAAAPVDAPWLWTLAFGHHEDRTPTAMSRRARRRWRGSRRVGGGSEPFLTLRVKQAKPRMRPIGLLSVSS